MGKGNVAHSGRRRALKKNSKHIKIHPASASSIQKYNKIHIKMYLGSWHVTCHPQTVCNRPKTGAFEVSSAEAADTQTVSNRSKTGI